MIYNVTNYEPVLYIIWGFKKLTDVRYFEICEDVASVGAAHNVVARTVGSQIVCQVTLYNQMDIKDLTE